MTTGVLLVQLGTPDAPTPRAVRRYLAAFLSDRRVVDVNPWLWKPLLHGVILRTRPRRSAALYKRVWTDAGSPLLVHTRAQAEALGASLGADFRVAFGMRVGTPAIDDALDGLLAAGCRRVVVLPLFPQFSSATTASAVDGVSEWARRRRDLPALRVVRDFADHPAYVAALRDAVRQAGAEPCATVPLLMSFHGLPERYAREGDPYPQACRRTAESLASALDLADDAWRVSYQSRFGREPWLQPYTDDVLRALPGEGVRGVIVTTPSFVADCLETIDEIGRVSREIFEAAGGERFTRVACPNASAAMIEALTILVREHA